MGVLEHEPEDKMLIPSEVLHPARETMQRPEASHRNK
jgi:hypothetical protein